MKIEGLTAFITGGGSGLGAATARTLAAKGVNVGIFDRNAEGAETVAKETGGIALSGDVSETSDIKDALAQLEGRFETPRIIVNCAGISTPSRIVGRNGPVDLEDFDKVIRVNLSGTFNVMRLAAAKISALDPLNKDGERGVIISTASVAAFEGQVGQASYAASKAGVAALTLPAAREFARNGIRVLAVAPGLFATPLMNVLPQEVQDSLGASVPFPSRLGTPEEFGELVQHMAENSMLNGEVVRLDGAVRLSA